MYMYVCNFHFVNERKCIFITQFDIFPGQMSYVNRRGPYVAPLGYTGYYIAGFLANQSHTYLFG